MKTFKQFLSESDEFKIQSLSKEDAFGLLEKSSYFRNVMNEKAGLIYRGFKSAPNFGIKDTRDFQRKAANIENYVNLWCSNDSSWRGFPPRDQSYICSSTSKYAESFGHLSLVFPLDGSSIGVCRDKDFWWSFDTINHLNLDVSDVSKIVKNQLTKAYFEKYNKEPENFGAVSTDYKSLVSFLKSLNYEDLLKTPGLAQQTLDFGKLSGKATLDQGFRYALDPEINGFTTVGPNGIRFFDDQEVWVHGKCVVVSIKDLQLPWYRPQESLREKVIEHLKEMMSSNDS